MTDLLLVTLLSATDYCLDFSKRPGLPSSHYQRHVPSKLPLYAGRDRVYSLQSQLTTSTIWGAPCAHSKSTPLHEWLDKDNVADTTVEFRVQEAKDERGWPPHHWSHPIVLGSPRECVLPIAVYVGGVPYALHDSVVGFWVIHFTTESRYLAAVVRKRLFCKCGCKSWSTLYPLSAFMQWSLQVMANRRFPSSRHDGSLWTASDFRRWPWSSKPMRIGCATLFVKGAWCEYAGTLGLPTWADGLRLCYRCNVSRSDFG